MSNNIYYIYAYLRSKDSDIATAGTPYYIGKGKNGRAYQHHGNRITVPKDKTKITFIAENLSEKEALELETNLIAKYGRKDLNTGILENLTDGGEGTSNPPQYVRDNQSKRMKNEPSVMLGRKHSPESLKKMSDIKIGKPSGFKGKTHTEESKIKLSNSAIGRQDSIETKIKKSIANKGENNPFYNKSHAEESKKLISEARKGKCWCHDPTLKVNKVCDRNNIPEGMIIGYVRHKNETKNI